MTVTQLGHRPSMSRTKTEAPVVIVPYDPKWPALFEGERVLLARVFSGVEATVEHVGSTAVPGLGGKPILDILVGVTVLVEVEARTSKL